MITIMFVSEDGTTPISVTMKGRSIDRNKLFDYIDQNIIVKGCNWRSKTRVSYIADGYWGHCKLEDDDWSKTLNHGLGEVRFTFAFGSENFCPEAHHIQRGGRAVILE